MLQIQRNGGTMANADKPGYYGKNIVQPHVWKPYIPTYFFLGGLAGAAAALASLSRLRRNDEAASAGFRIALGAIAVSGGLLILDLGVPKRFVNMLRMVKPTSPMSLGTWLIQAFGATAAVAVACDALGKRRSPIARAAETACGLLGLPLCVYTAVLLSDTATPVWFEARGDLPFLFVGGAASSAGAAIAAFVSRDAGRAARRFSLVGGLFEYAMHHRMRSALGALGEPYDRGKTRALAKSATTCTIAGTLVLQLAGGVRAANALGSALVLAGALLERFSVFEAGSVSARDPKYALLQQRAGGGYGAVAGTAR